MIDARIEPVVAIAARWRRHEVGKRGVAIGLRIQRGDVFADWIDKNVRNLVSLKRLLSEWIDRRREKALREIAAALGKGWHVGDSRASLANAPAFVINEEKCPVLNYWAAQGSAKLVPLILRCFFAGGREEVTRVERAVAEELVNCAVISIRS